MAARWLNILRGNRAYARLMLGASLLLVVTVLVAVMVRIDRSSLIPPKADRYDVTQFYIGAVSALCPKSASSLEVKALEECLGSLSLDEGKRQAAFRSVALPTFDDSLAGSSPSLKTLLIQQGLEIWEKTLAHREPYVIGIRIPRELTRLNQIGVEPNILVLDGMQDGRVCMQGRCPTIISKYEQYLLFVPLALTEPATDDFVDVFLVGKDTVFAYGPNIENGIWVTAPSKLYTAKRLFPLVAYGKSLMLATLFIGLFLMAFGFAAIWSEFLDYGAFCYLTASFALYTITNEATLVRLRTWSIFDFYQFKLAGDLNLFAAMVCFALATNRAKARGVVAILGGTLSVGIASILASAPRDSREAVIRWANQFESYLFIGMAIVPAAIILYGGIACYGRFRNARATGPLSLRLDFQRRTIEQVIYLILVSGIAAQQLMATGIWLNGAIDPARFAPSTGFFLFAIFAIIIYHSTAKLAKTHFRTDGISEAARLKGRLTARAYHAWLTEARHGIMLQVDVKNSSVASSSLKSRIHLLMENLHSAMKACHGRLNYHWILAKKNGDEWIVILSPKHPTLRQDLEEVVAATRRDVLAWKALVQSMAPECSLHVNVFALNSYSLAGEKQAGASARANGGAWDIIDFASREANYLMKWAGKSMQPDSLTVGASLAVLPESLTAEATSMARVSNLIAAQKDASAESVLDADSMSLALLNLPWGKQERDRAA